MASPEVLMQSLSTGNVLSQSLISVNNINKISAIDDVEDIDWDVNARINYWRSFQKQGGSSNYLGAQNKNRISERFDSEIERNPYSVKLWILYLEAQKTATIWERFELYERAVVFLPRSYKIWYRYLQERVVSAIGEPPTSQEYTHVNNTFERALVHLSQMPVIWLLYFDFLQKQSCITKTRRSFDRALQSLPITQHSLIWEKYIQYINDIGVPITSVAVYRRYLMLEPSKVGIYIDLLKRIGRYDDAASVLARTLNNDMIPVEGKTSHQLWLDLCDLITEHPESIKSLNTEKVLRSGLRRFTEQTSRLWCSLANHYILLGQIDKCRDIFEEALATVATTHDFGIIFDTYANFLESVLTKLLGSETSNPLEVDLFLARLEDIVERRPALLSSVKLRQNPNNVVEWLHRVQLFSSSPTLAVKTFTTAVLTVDPYLSVGKMTYLWIQFAKYYEKHDDLNNARAVYEKAIVAKFRSVDDLALIWTSWVEMEIRHKEYKAALEIARRSIHRPSATEKERLGYKEDTKGYHQSQVFRNSRLWSLCVDLEENFGTLATLEACYDKMFDLKVITPGQLLNYATLLEEKKFWEKAFRVYERGIAIFRWPHVYDVWLTYLGKFVSRYGGRKLERARELFDQALADAPPHLCKRLFLLFGKLEETYGLARHAIAIYDRATQRVDTPEDIFDFFNLLVAKNAEFFGITRTRPIFERGIERLSATEASAPLAVQFGLRFVAVERSLGEIDRARAILQHCSQLCDPKTSLDFWQQWREFEVAHGNEDLFRDMLRIKRSVQAVYAEVSQKSTDIILEAAAAAQKETSE